MCNILLEILFCKELIKINQTNAAKSKDNRLKDKFYTFLTFFLSVLFG